ncbi:MAG: hypothetical protein QM664_02460 [Flavihumibacter sp.]
MKRNTFLSLAAFLICVAAQAAGSYPAVPVKNASTWTGTVSKLWSNPANWKPVGVPGPGNTVVFNAVKDDTCVIDIPADVYSLVLIKDNPNTTVIQQSAALNARYGIDFGYGIWKTSPGVNESNTILTVPFGPANFLHGQLEITGNVFFGGDVFYDLFIAEFYGEIAYKKNLTLSENAILPAFATAVFNGDGDQKISGALYAVNKLVVNKPRNTALVLNGQDISMFNPPLSVFAAEIELIDGVVKGPGGLYAADRRFFVHRDFDGLESFVILSGGFLTATINAPLLTSYKSEIRVENADVIFTTDNSAALTIGNGRGKMIFRHGGYPTYNGVRDLQLNIAQLEIEGGATPGKFVAPPGNTTLYGNMVNNGIFTAGAGQFIMAGGGYTQVKPNTPIVFNHLTVNKDSNATLFLANGKITVGERFTAVSGTLTGPGALEVEGPVKAGAGLKNASVQLIFSGARSQTIDFGPVPAAWTGKICFRKDDADSILLISPWKIGTNGMQSVVFDRGILYTSNYFLLELGANAQVSGANAKSFVEGPVSKTGSTAFTFPVGAKKVYAPVRISGTNFWDAIGGVTAYQVNYARENPQVALSSGFNKPINFISSREYWKIVRTGDQEAKIWLSYTDQRSGTGVFKDIVPCGYDQSVKKWNKTGDTKAFTDGMPFAGMVSAGSYSVFSLASANKSSSRLAETEHELALSLPSATAPLPAASVYPNPAGKQAIITLVHAGWQDRSIEFRLLDNKGRVCQRQQVIFNAAGQGSFRLGNCTPGIYCLQPSRLPAEAAKIIVVD